MLSPRGWLWLAAAAGMTVALLLGGAARIWPVKSWAQGIGLQSGSSMQAERIPPMAGWATPVVGHPPAAWSSTPALGSIPDERYLGRIVVQRGRGSAFIPSGTEALVARARDALEVQRAFAHPPAVWDAEPDLLIIELWSTSVRIAVSEDASRADELIREAITELQTHVR